MVVETKGFIGSDRRRAKAAAILVERLDAFRRNGRSAFLFVGEKASGIERARRGEGAGGLK
jgi:hypothetical protein